MALTDNLYPVYTNVINMSRGFYHPQMGAAGYCPEDPYRQLQQQVRSVSRERSQPRNAAAAKDAVAEPMVSGETSIWQPRTDFGGGGGYPPNRRQQASSSGGVGLGRSSSIRLRKKRDQVKQEFVQNRRSGEFGYRTSDVMMMNGNHGMERNDLLVGQPDRPPLTGQEVKMLLLSCQQQANKGQHGINSGLPADSQLLTLTGDHGGEPIAGVTDLYSLPVTVGEMNARAAGGGSALLKGLLWMQKDRIFSRWKERFFILTSDHLHCFKKAVTSISEMGNFIFKVSLASVETVEITERRGYLTVVLTLQKEAARLVLRRTEGIREWYEAIRLASSNLSTDNGHGGLGLNEARERQKGMQSTKEFWSPRQLQAKESMSSTGSANIEDWLLGRQFTYSCRRQGTPNGRPRARSEGRTPSTAAAATTGAAGQLNSGSSGNILAHQFDETASDFSKPMQQQHPSKVGGSVLDGGNPRLLEAVNNNQQQQKRVPVVMRRQRPASSSYMFTPIDVASLGKATVGETENLGDSSMDFDTRQTSPYSQRRSTRPLTNGAQFNGRQAPSRPQAVRPMSHYFDCSSNDNGLTGRQRQPQSLITNGNGVEGHSANIVMAQSRHARPASLYAMPNTTTAFLDANQQHNMLPAAFKRGYPNHNKVNNIQTVNANYQLRQGVVASDASDSGLYGFSKGDHHHHQKSHHHPHHHHHHRSQSGSSSRSAGASKERRKSRGAISEESGADNNDETGKELAGSSSSEAKKKWRERGGGSTSSSSEDRRMRRVKEVSEDSGNSSLNTSTTDSRRSVVRKERRSKSNQRARQIAGTPTGSDTTGKPTAAAVIRRQKSPGARPGESGREASSDRRKSHREFSVLHSDGDETPPWLELPVDDAV